MPGARLVRRIARAFAPRTSPIATIALRLFMAIALAPTVAVTVVAALTALTALTAVTAVAPASAQEHAVEGAPAAGATAAPAPAPAPAPSESASNGEPRMPAATDLEMMPRSARRAREASLSAVLSARRQVESDLRELQAELRSDEARGREPEIERQIRARSDDLAGLARSFSELATGVDPLSLEVAQEPSAFEISREVRVLLAPLINELKRATSRPREIDRLRTEIADLDEQLKTIDAALAQLDAVAAGAKGEDLVKALATERKDWNRRRAAIEATLEVAEQKLEQRATESKSVRQAIQDVFQGFFKSRGRNLLFALAATLAFLFVFGQLGRFIADRPAFERRERSLSRRAFALAYTIFTSVGGVAVFVVALYLFGDWVLLTVAVLLLLGVAWASKQALPRFWTQTVLILDMGAVREGQRVWLNGLAWRVESIAFYCVLVNPALAGGRIRIPLDDVASLRSRPEHPDEPWFPTNQGDIILLEKSRPAIVEFQSTEVVRLRSPGGNLTMLPTAQFAAQSHEILSHGYRVDVQFGIDHQSHEEITTTMRDTFEVEVEHRWRETDWARSLVDVAVEFSSAGRSSLDYFVRVDLDGSQAFDYAAQRRHLASICVDVCNENGWEIPIAQMKVHLAPPPEEGTNG